MIKYLKINNKLSSSLTYKKNSNLAETFIINIFSLNSSKDFLEEIRWQR